MDIELREPAAETQCHCSVGPSTCWAFVRFTKTVHCPSPQFSFSIFFHFRLLVVFLSFVLVSFRFYHFSFSLTKIAFRDSIAIDDGARYSSRWYNNRCYFIF